MNKFYRGLDEGNRALRDWPTSGDEAARYGAPNLWRLSQMWATQSRYYDFNVHSEEKRIEKTRYIHRNPVVRGLVEHPEDYRWSGFNHYATGETGAVEIESEWTARRRERIAG